MPAEGVDFEDASAPDGVRLYAVGDVHGRLDLLEAMHFRIMEEVAADRAADWRIVHLGDYTDRGPQSRGVIDFLQRARLRDRRIVTLCGNHDAGFLEFLEKPDIDGTFARNGGRETALSYGVEIDFSTREKALPGHAALCAAVPRQHVEFLRSLRLSATFGDFFFCHAGIRPGVALDRQQAHDLLWIRAAFHDHRGLYPKVVVHGHTPVPEAETMPNRVNLDTGAWFSGRLTAIAVEGRHKRLLEVRS